MGILSDFIAATPDEIAAAFPTWLTVADAPIARETKNPFTGETQTVTEWVPAVPASSEIDDASTLGNYRHLPHADFKGITHIELAELANAINGADVDAMVDLLSKPELLDPRGSNETGLHRFPESFADSLAAITENDIVAISDRWASSEEMTYHQASANDCAAVLRELVRLAKIADASNAHLYLWWSL